MIKDNTDLLTSFKEMGAALQEELDCQEIAPRKLPIKNGRLIGQDGSLFFYRFELESYEELNDDQPIRLQYDGQEINGSVVTAAGALITLAFESSLPDRALNDITLIYDQTYLLRALQEVIKQTTDSSTSSIARKLMRLESAQYGTAKNKVSYGSHFTPYEAQRRAIEQVLGSEITFVIGPPGTGKTSTLAAIVLSFLCQGKSVVVASHTNIAVDNAIAALARLCKNANQGHFIQDDMIVRYGNAQTDEVRKDEHVYLPLIVKRRGGVLGKERDALERELQAAQVRLRETQIEWSEIEKEIATLNREKAQIQIRLPQIELDYQQSQREHARQIEEALRRKQYLIDQIKQLEDKLAELGQRYRMNSRNLDISSRRLAEATEALRVIAGKKGISRWLHHQRHRTLLADQEQLRSYSITIQAEQRGIKQHGMACRDQQIHIEGELTQHLQEIERLEETIIPQPSEMQTAQQRLHEIDARLHILNERTFAPSLLEQNIQILQERIATIDEQLRGIQQQVLQAARVIGTTLTKIYMNKELRTRAFDVVIIDEVSMALLPSVFVTACCATSALALFGDPLQLDPIVQQDPPGPNSQRWLISAFDYWEIGLARRGKESVFLDEQARMHPQISSIVRKHVYSNLLKDSPRVVQIKSDYEPLAGQALILCDTSKAAPSAIRPNNQSRINVYHAICDLALAQQVIQSVPEQKRKEAKPILGIITPYAKQARFITQLVKSAGFQDLIHVGTVHRFQGLEFDTIIFDATDSAPINMYDKFIGTGLKATRLINVALTRARRKLIVVANTSYLAQQQAKGNVDSNSVLLKGVEEARKYSVIDATMLLPNIQASAIGKAVPASITIGTLPVDFLNETQYFEALLRDIQSAKKSIIIFSPFVGKRLTDTILPALIEARTRGVACHVYMRSSGNEKQHFIEQLIKVSDVLTRDNMHEKCVIIDDTISYYGSLNTLSQANSTEIMVQYHDPSIAAMLRTQIIGRGGWKDARQNDENVIYGEDIIILFDHLRGISHACPKCGETFRLRGKEGFFFGHGTKEPGRCANTIPADAETLGELPPLQKIACQDHPSTYLKIEAKPTSLYCPELGCHFRRKVVYQDDRQQWQP